MASTMNAPARVFSTAEDDRRLVFSILISVMKNGTTGAVPREFWHLSRSIDLLAARGVVLNTQESVAYYERHLRSPPRYPLVSIRTLYGESNVPITLSASIRKATFGLGYNSLVTLALGIEKLRFVDNMNHPINLPSSLKHVTFGGGFHESVIFPTGLKFLCLGGGSSLPIILPEGLEELYLGGGAFNQPLTLPDSLKRLTLSHDYNQPTALPLGLEELWLGPAFSQQLTLPPALRVLRIPHGSQSIHPLYLNEHLQTLEVGGSCYVPLDLPPGLVNLVWFVNEPITLPPSLKSLYLGALDGFQQPIDLPEGLEELRFRGKYDLPLLLPSSLKNIYFESRHDMYELPLDLPLGCALHENDPRAHVDECMGVA